MLTLVALAGIARALIKDAVDEASASSDGVPS